MGTRRTIIVGADQWQHWQAWCAENDESVSGIIRRLMDRHTGRKQPANGSESSYTGGSTRHPASVSTAAAAAINPGLPRASATAADSRSAALDAR